MDKTELNKVLDNIDANLQYKTTLHIRGGSACILHGEEYRVTIDIDTIPQGSHYDKEDLEQACRKAGVLLDPTSFDDLESGKPYLQLLPQETLILPVPAPGGTQTPWNGNQLKVTTPSPPDLVISKLKRCDTVDIQDIAFLILKFEVTADQLKDSYKRLPAHFQEDIILKENFENTLRDFYDVSQETHKKCPPPKRTSKAERLHSPLELESH